MQDLYIIEWITKNTEKSNSSIKWKNKEGSGQYFSTVQNEIELVELRIGCVMSRSGSRIFLEFSTEDCGVICIEEPHMSVSFFRKYDSRDDKELAEGLKRLFSVVVRQQLTREKSDFESKEERKQEIFKKLLGIG